MRSRPSALPKLKHFLDLHPEATVIATCRRAVNGGKFKGSASAQFDILIKAAATGFQLVDIELQSAEILKAANLRELKDRVGVILSFHDFKATKKLEETFAEMKRYPADFYKVVSTATTLYDNVTHDEVPAGALRPARDGGTVHGRAGNHQPRIGRAGRKRLYLWRPRLAARKPRPARLPPANCAIPIELRWSMPPLRFTGWRAIRWRIRCRRS